MEKSYEFSDESIKRLNEEQNDDRFHGYTCCGYDGCVRSEQPNWGKLIATKEGWICPCGKYKQNWYHV